MTLDRLIIGTLLLALGAYFYYRYLTSGKPKRKG